MTFKTKLLVSLDTDRGSAYGDVCIVASQSSLLHLLMPLRFARRVLCSMAFQLHGLQAGCGASSQTACYENKVSLAKHKVRHQWPAASVLCLLHAHNAEVICPAGKVPQMEQC